ncbi:MAG: AIR synthase family protein [Candidatus Bathyarchaeia archaeon]
MKLAHGKIPIDILESVVFKNLGIRRREVVLGPSAGIDGAVINVGNKSLVVSTDPITGAIELIGWLAVNINANDIATFGVEPAFLLSCILLPENADMKTVETISEQMGKAAKELGIAIVGGHCEVTPGLANPIVVGCTIGMTEKGNYVTAAGAKQGDKIILTKTAGIEGTAVLASDKENQLKKVVSATTLRNAKRFYDQISVVKDAITAFKTGAVHAMHDPTEGGVAGGIHEMADASHLGFRVHKKKIPVRPETTEICNFFEIDPLQLTASGSLLIAVERDSADRVVGILSKEGITAEVIGEFLPSVEERIIIQEDGSSENLVRPVSDHLWSALEKIR